MNVPLSVLETGEGPCMLFQHGLCGDAAQPAEVFPFEAGWRCLTMECRGHGQSDAGPPEEFSIATFAEDLVSLIQARGLAPVVLGGISMGAAIALRIAVLQPHLVRALVLARPAWAEESAPSNLQPNATVGELLRHYPPDQARTRFEASGWARTLAEEAPDNLATLRSLFTRQPMAVTAELLCRISADGPGVTRHAIAAIRVPTLVIGHARDYVHPLAMARSLAAMIPLAQMVEIAPKAENKELYRENFKAALFSFLKDLQA